MYFSTKLNSNQPPVIVIFSCVFITSHGGQYLDCGVQLYSDKQGLLEVFYERVLIFFCSIFLSISYPFI